MFHVYTQKRGEDLTKTLIKDFKDLEEAFDFAEKTIEGKAELKFIIEQTTGHVDSYGNLLADFVTESD